jgi:hypothetical protein
LKAQLECYVYILFVLRVFESRLLRKIFGPKRVEVRGGWRKFHNELHNWHSSPNIIRMIKSRTMRWVGHIGDGDGGDEKFIQSFGWKT